MRLGRARRPRRAAELARAKSVAAQKLETVQVRLEGLGSAEALTEFALGLQLRAYAFDLHKSDAREEAVPTVALAGGEFDGSAAAALAEGVALSRDLVNEPANVLTPPEFAARIRKLGGSDGHPGLDVEILGEAELEALGMGALLAVGRGSRKESHVAIMRWTGAADPKAAPLCLIGKGVCFDTGGISLKPAGGMEEMTMDMGGAAAVVGAMAAIAGRKSKANVVGVVGLVENMPDGDAQRPGDIVTSMSGKTIEVINTDAEGRLVLCDVIHYAQERFAPRAMVDLATLTGAIIVALGHDKAGFFANDEKLAAALQGAADEEGEGIWRMPLGDSYDKQLKSRLADMKNVGGGRQAGSITAAQFLQRFVKDGSAWAHIDIAGVCLPKEDGATWPKGPSGWGVATLTRLAETMFADAAD
ncbi:MAG: leucyl aminopeptidase [Pseudomonadota bacterium]